MEDDQHMHDNRSRQLNPRDVEAQQSRTNVMNPSHVSYWRSRGKSVPDAKNLARKAKQMFE